MRDKLLGEIRFLIVNLILGPFLGLLVCLAETFKIIRFVNYTRFPQWEEKLIIVSNHPSLVEPVLLPVMGFPWMNFPWVFSPVWKRIRFSLTWFRELQQEFSLSKKLIPANLPDKQNFYDPPYLKLFQGINIPVDRNGGVQDRASIISVLQRVLENGGRIIIFPEGSRTFKTDKEFRRKTASGQELGKLKDGAAWLALKTGARILPIWIEGTNKFLPNNRFPLPRFWHRITIKVGEPFILNQDGTTRVSRKVREEATELIAQALLKTADKKG